MATTAQNNSPINWILVLISLICLWAAFRSCKPVTITKTDNEPLKQEIRLLTKQRDSLLNQAPAKDSIRTEYITRWRKLKGDTIFRALPCDTILPILVQSCDSIIAADSVLIADLKAVIQIDDSLLTNYRKHVVNDSLLISELNKDLRKQKRQKKLAVFAAGILGVVAIVK